MTGYLDQLRVIVAGARAIRQVGVAHHGCAEPGLFDTCTNLRGSKLRAEQRRKALGKLLAPWPFAPLGQVDRPRVLQVIV